MPTPIDIDLSRFVSIEIPVFSEVKGYIQNALPSIQGKFVVNRSSTVGRSIMLTLSGKRKSMVPGSKSPKMNEMIEVMVHPNVAQDYGCVVPDGKAKDLNLYLKGVLQEQLNMHLALSQKHDPAYNIRIGIESWMAMIGVSVDAKSVDSFKRNYFNWRLQEHPDLIRNRGRVPKYLR